MSSTSQGNICETEIAAIKINIRLVETITGHHDVTAAFQTILLFEAKKEEISKLIDSLTLILKRTIS